MYVWRVCARGPVRAALRPGVGANVTLRQVADEAQQPRAPIGSPGSNLNKLDTLANIFEAKGIDFELRLSLQRVLLKFIRAPLWYPTQPVLAQSKTSALDRHYKLQSCQGSQCREIADIDSSARTKNSS